MTIAEKEFGFAGLAHGLHRLHGYRGGWLYQLWAVGYDLASAGLIVFALSGGVLWYQSTTCRWPGFVCIGLSFGFTAAMILYLMWRK